MQSVVVLFVVCCPCDIICVKCNCALSVCKNEICTRFHVVQDVLANLSGVSERGVLMYFSTITWGSKQHCAVWGVFDVLVAFFHYYMGDGSSIVQWGLFDVLVACD